MCRSVVQDVDHRSFIQTSVSYPLCDSRRDARPERVLQELLIDPPAGNVLHGPNRGHAIEIEGETVIRQK